MQDQVQAVEDRIQCACDAAGRPRDSVELVAVSKKQSVDRIAEAVRAGLTVFGENRVQEAVEKMASAPSACTWHLIGHVQTNKAKILARTEFALIHSVDSLRLLEALEEACEETGRRQPVLLQVNVSGESSKFGMKPEELAAVLERAASCRRVEVEGLMTMPPFTEDPAQAAPHFAALRDLRDRMRADSGFPLSHLSMGMSHDLEVAIREGATLVRVGTDLFGSRSPTGD